MNSVIDRLNTRVIPAIALDQEDGRWASTLNNSLPGRLITGLVTSISAHTKGLSTVGDYLQLGGFGLMVLMFLIIAAPQFANDKGILALLTVAAFGLRVLGSLLNGKEHYRPSAIDAIVLLYFGINVIASFASHYLTESLYGLSKLVVYLIAYFLFAWCFQYNTKSRIITVLFSLAAGALLVSLYGLYQYKMGVAPLATWEDPSVEDKTTRVFSTLGNPNFLAGYLIPIIPFGLALTAAAANCRNIKRWLTLPLLGGTGIILLATVLTGSRGGWLAMIAQVLVLLAVASLWLWKQFPRARNLMVVGVVLLPMLVIAGIHFLAPSYEHRFLSIFSGSEHSSNAYRMNVYRASLNMFKDNWWIGIGTGNKTFEQAYGLYMKSGFDALGTYSVPLEIGVETGIPGLLAFGWLLMAVGARAHRRFWGSRDFTTCVLALSCMAAIVGMMAHGLFDTIFYRPQVHFIFWLTVAILVSIPQEDASTAESAA